MWTDTSAPRTASVRFVDAEQVRAFYADEYAACVGITEAAPRSGFVVAADRLQMGPIEVTEHRRTAGMAFRMEREDAYLVCLHTAGTVTLEYGDDAVAATTTRAVLHRPGIGPAVIRSGAPSRSRGLVIERWAMTACLEGLLDRPVAPTVAMAPTVALDTGHGRAWLALLDLFTAALTDPGHLAFRPAVATPLSQALVTGLLMTTTHPYSAVLHQPATPCRPRHVKIAIDAMHAHPDHPHTTGSLARLAGVGIRTLQAGFRHHVDLSPMAYLRQVRLDRAHEDLLSGHAATIAEAAHRWGLTHLGRFAADYRARYGALPSAVLAGAKAPTRF